MRSKYLKAGYVFCCKNNRATERDFVVVVVVVVIIIIIIVVMVMAVVIIIVIVIIVSSSSLLWSGSIAFGILLYLLYFFQAFYPRPVYDENSEVDEDVLKRVIDDALVSDAVAVFRLLQKKGKSKSCQRTDIMLD